MNKRRFRGIRYWVMAAVACALLSGCVTQRHPDAQKQQARESIRLQAAGCFHTADVQNFEGQRTRLEELTAERHPELPLVLCELASFHLVTGKNTDAEKCLDQAIDLLENFWDETKEAQALSVWGPESAKVYKGDPYERAILFMLSGLSKLQQGRIDEARARFRRAILMDADSQGGFHADFALLYLLEARCNELLGETVERNNVLREAASSFFSCATSVNAPKQRQIFSERLNESPKLLSALDKALIAWSGGINADVFRTIKPAVKQVLQKQLPDECPTDFNTLLVLWNGVGPRMEQQGRHGEIRHILPGTPYALKSTQAPLDIIPADIPGNSLPFGPLFLKDAWANVSYQAMTRGERLMDRENAKKSTIKTATDSSGQALQLAGAITSISGTHTRSHATEVTGAVLQLSGIAMQIASAYMTAQADTRCWRCLPNDFQVLCLKLPPGNHTLVLQAKDGNTIRQTMTLTFATSEQTPCHVIHLLPPHQTMTLTTPAFSLSSECR